MGYTTEFNGQIEIVPPLNAEEIAYLNKFNQSRRMLRTEGPYYAEPGTTHGQYYNNPSVLDHNCPPQGQPGLWCQWVPTNDGTAIEWDGGEKFYDSAKWMKYLIEHFIGSDPKAKDALPFLQPHILNGTIKAQGEDSEDRWDLVVRDNKVYEVSYEFKATNEREI